MKKTALLSCWLGLSALSVFGIGATQEWVRRHVNAELADVLRKSVPTNFSVSADIPASAFLGADTNYTYSCTIRAEVGQHPALKVISSTVSAIPAGTFYALDANGCYVNCSNSLITTIYAVPYTVETVTTNAFGGVSTNSVHMGNFFATDATNGVWRMGIDGDTILYNSGRRTDHIVIRSTTLPERAAAVLAPPQTAHLSIREIIFSLIVPTAHARTENEIEYTINSGTTVTIGELTFTRTNRFGKETTITFVPQGLEGVYCGPEGPFASKEEARAAVSNLDNWNFKYDGRDSWLYVLDEGARREMSRADFENSDVWKQLCDKFDTNKTETIVETPKVLIHPCPAPDDFFYVDFTIWNDVTIPRAQAAALALKVNLKYAAANDPYDYDRDLLDQWRGENECKCEFDGCPNRGVSKHRVGRVRIKDGEETYSDDVDGGDGCKCCIRCAKYGSDIFKTIDEYNDHRASGEGSGFCGCACDKYTDENEDEWDKDYHNLPAHTLAWPDKDYSCMCYCSKDKALNGEYVRHAKYAGPSPWCDDICARCGMVEDKEQYITHSYPAFDTRHVTLREAEWKDHKPRAEADGSVSMLNDSTYYDRCGCACGAYDTADNGVLPKDFGKFHQMRTSGQTCLCFCGQIHKKNGDGSEPDYPCPEICAICNMIEDKEANQTIIIDGGTYAKLVLRQPTEWGDHEPSETACGCKCGYIEAEDDAETEAETKIFHIARDDEFACLCECKRFHEGEWETKTCGVHSWRQCSLFPDHIYEGDEAAHEYAGGHDNDETHYCKCADKVVAKHTKVAGAVRYEHNGNQGWIITTKSCNVSGCGWTKDERTACTHSWGNWLEVSDFPGGTLFRHTCGICGAFEDMLVDYADAQICNTNINLHIPATDVCGCKCGYYGSGAKTAEEKDFHKWNATDIENGVANCHCQCGSKHEFRDGCACPDVCAFCKDILRDGTKSEERDHIPAERSQRRCGCKCGFFGVTSAHGAAGRAARTVRLHIQSMENNVSSAAAPAYCQCFGEGNGGSRHWCYPRNSSTSCGKICQYVRSVDTLGHRVAQNSPSEDIFHAEPNDHTGKTDHMRSGSTACGCKCGLCNNGNRDLWKAEAGLHQYYALADDRCHCDCDEKVLCGDTNVDGERHTFPVSNNDASSIYVCTCTCGSKHRLLTNSWIAKGKCGYLCNVCGKLIKSDGRAVANVSSNHHFDPSGKCKCDCGDHVNPDGHWYPSGSCTCQCGGETLLHIIQSSSTATGNYPVCDRCGAVFIEQTTVTSCTRCGTVFESETVNLGDHEKWCGKKTIKKGCAYCGCSNHDGMDCVGHYCKACCKAKPTPKRRPAESVSIPDPCRHSSSRILTATRSWNCDICDASFVSVTKTTVCSSCGCVLATETARTGEHGDHSGSGGSGGSGDSGQGGEACSYCGGVGYHQSTCPLYQPTGSGNTGGTGNINDI